MIEAPIRREIHPIPIGIGLQARLLLGGNALNPNARNLPPLTENDLGNFAQRDYSPFNQASANERANYWQGKGDDIFARQKESWINQVTEIFQKSPELTGILAALEIENAESLFEKYCLNREGHDIKQFVRDVLNLPTPSQMLTVIQHLAGMFGETSAEIVKHLVDAETQLLTQPEQLVEAANSGRRINRLTTDEKRLLRFVSGSEEEVEQQVRPARPKLPEGLEWRTERDGRLSAQEAAETIANIKDLETIEEKQELKNYLESKNIGEDLLLQIVNNVIEHYREFVKNTYGIDLPQIEGLDIFPISGLTSQIYNPMQADAFVRAGIPLIFLDIDRLKRVAFGEEKFRNIFAGTIIHEYTHLTADHALRRLIKVDENGQEISEIDGGLGKLGLMFIRYFLQGNQQLRVENEERGRYLNEAITEKMVEKWSHTYPYKAVDATAYPAERKVLAEIIQLVAQEQNMSEDEVSTLFVRAHFGKEGLRPLVQALTGPDYQRPYFLSTVYALMDYEKGPVEKPKQTNYPLTLAFIKDELRPHQIQEIAENIDDLYLSPAAKNHLEEIFIEEVSHAA